MIPAEWLQFAPKPNPLEKGQSWHVFLSYRSVNRGWVLNLYDVLTELKFKVFLDQYVLIGGNSLPGMLEEGLASSQAGVLIWSNAARDSAWVKNEYYAMITRVASDEKFRFIPIKVEPVPLPVFASSRLFMDFTDYPDGPNGGELLRLLHGIVGKPLGKDAIEFAYDQDDAARVAAVKVSAAIRNDKPDILIRLYTEGGLPWRTTAALACKAADGLIKLGREDDAITMLGKIQQDFPKAIRPKQLAALALARRGKDGDLDLAQDIIGELYAAKNLDPETMGIYGRTWMDRYLASDPPRPDLLRQSRGYYAHAFEMAPTDYYTGINAAAKSIFLGEIDKGLEFAERVGHIVGTEVVADDYWQTATVAEVMLIKKDYDGAARMYQEAVDIAPNEKRSHDSTAKQARLLLEALGASPEEIAKVMKPF